MKLTPSEIVNALKSEAVCYALGSYNYGILNAAASHIESQQAEIDEYHAWQQGKIGVEEYLTLQVKYRERLVDITHLTNENAMLEKDNKRLMETNSSFQETIRKLIESIATDRWIPVGEKLPEEPYGCLLMVDEDDYFGEPHSVLLPEFAGYDGIGWNNGGGERIPFEVNHWRPLPEPPKEDTNEQL